MANIANVIAFDGEATTIAHTFVPISVRNDGEKTVALYREVTSGVPLEAQPTLILSQEKIAKSRVTKFIARVSVPVMESVNGNNAAGYTAPPAVAYTVTAEAVFFAHGRSTPQQRRNLRLMLANILLGKETTTGPYNTGPGPDLIENGISPT